MRTTPTLLILFIFLAAPTLALAQERRPLTAQLDGQTVSGSLTSTQRGFRLELAGLSAPGQRIGHHAYRYALVPKRGARGALIGEQSQTLNVWLIQPQSGQVSGTIHRAGKLVGVVRLKPKPPPPPTPIRQRWWAAVPVAGWELVRSTWDFATKDHAEALRGDATPAQATALRDALRKQGKGPYGPKQIYTAARARTKSRKAALHLAFALVNDHTLALKPLPGIPANSPRHDKYKHYFGSAVLAYRSNKQGSIAVGWLKEIHDQIVPGGTGYNAEDLQADRLGATFGQALRR